MSYRSDNHGSYDHTLLSTVPGPTRAEKQEGYNVDLLEAGRDRGAPSPPNNGATSDHNGGLDYSPGAMSYARKEEPPATTTNHYEPLEKRAPWYRTRNGIIIIVVVILAIIGVAVGAGVGASQKHHHSNASTGTSGTGSSNSNGTQDSFGQSASSTSTSKPASTSTSAESGPNLSQGVPPAQTSLTGSSNGNRRGLA